MCTLLVAVRRSPERPLIVAANRDERLDRASAPPAARRFGDRRAFAPLDLEAGGTWMGLNDAGLFAGLTNRFVPGPTPGQLAPDRRSRGLIVADALAAASRAEAIAAVRAHGGAAHNPFHLVVADRTGATLLWGDGVELHGGELKPGLHVLTERSFEAAPSGREDALRRERADLQHADLEQLKAALAVHRSNPFDSTCVHADHQNYGTCSASLVTFSASGPEGFWFAEGPPCVTEWRPHHPAMHAALA